MNRGKKGSNRFSEYKKAVGKYFLLQDGIEGEPCSLSEACATARALRKAHLASGAGSELFVMVRDRRYPNGIRQVRDYSTEYSRTRSLACERRIALDSWKAKRKLLSLRRK